MTTTSPRRGFLRGLATLPLAAGGAVPALAGPAEPDPVFAMFEAVAAAWDCYDAADEAADQAYGRYKGALPPRPAALRCLPDDRLPVPYAAELDGARWYTAPCVDAFRRWREPPGGQARRDEIVAAYDLWKATCDRVQIETGLSAAQDANRQADEHLDEHIEAMIAARATTIDGFVAKARAVLWCNDQAAGEWRVGDLTTDHRIAFSIVRDILAMEHAKNPA